MRRCSNPGFVCAERPQSWVKCSEISQTGHELGKSWDRLEKRHKHAPHSPLVMGAGQFLRKHPVAHGAVRKSSQRPCCLWRHWGFLPKPPMLDCSNTSRATRPAKVFHFKPLMVLKTASMNPMLVLPWRPAISLPKNGYCGQCIRPIRRLKKGTRAAQSLVRLEVVNPPYSNTPLSSRKKALRSEKGNREIQLTLIDLRFGKIGVVAQGCT